MYQNSDEIDVQDMQFIEFDLDNFAIQRGMVVSKWLPLLLNGQPILILPNMLNTYYLRLNGMNQGSLITVTASLVEMVFSPDMYNSWLPKKGAAIIRTVGVNLYAPHGQITVYGINDYVRPVPVGVMLHLGF